MQDFSFTEEKRDDGIYYCTIKGKVSINEALYIEHTLEKVMQSGCRHIIMNMCLVNMLTSVGIRAILSIYKKLWRVGGKLQIEAPSENVRNVIGITALDEMLLK
jgi:anti-anti-sigma factor